MKDKKKRIQVLLAPENLKVVNRKYNEYAPRERQRNDLKLQNLFKLSFIIGLQFEPILLIVYKTKKIFFGGGGGRETIKTFVIQRK